MTLVTSGKTYEVSIDGARRMVADFALENGFTCFPFFDSDDYISEGNLDPKVFEVIVAEAMESRMADLSGFDPYWLDYLLFMNLRSTEDRMHKGFVPDINKNHVLVGWIH